MPVKVFVLGTDTDIQATIALDVKRGVIGIRATRTWGGKPIPGDEVKTVVFKVGEKAVSGSYNLIYLDPIAGITEKNVIFGKDPAYGPNAPKKRMKLSKFVSYNWNFNRAQIDRTNAETSQYI